MIHLELFSISTELGIQFHFIFPNGHSTNIVLLTESRFSLKVISYSVLTWLNLEVHIKEVKNIQSWKKQLATVLSPRSQAWIYL